MNLLSTTALAIRLLGIYVLMGVVSRQSNWIEVYSKVGQGDSVLSDIFSFTSIGFLVVSLCMIVFPVTIARLLQPQVADNQQPVSAGAREFEVRAYSLLGVFAVCWALPNLASNVAYVVLYSPYQQLAADDRILHLKANVASNVVQIIVGSMLIAKAGKLANIVSRLRGQA